MTLESHPRFLEACKKVADDWRELAHAIRKEDRYAAHVTEETKLERLQEMLDHADEIEAGQVKSFTIWQRVNLELTGEKGRSSASCVPFLKG